ncbi:MAG TPA: nucleotide exchange factor GrpE [Caldilineaceae bacterium]|nr:nucleotide exchange factor GrpE [Caldilineaceae bacterium]
METHPPAGAPASPSPSSPGDLAQVQQRLLQLSSQIDALQARLERVTAGLGQESSQLALLVQYLTTRVREEDPLEERLLEFTEQMSADHEQLIFLSRKLTELATQDQLVRLATLVATQQQVMELAEAVRELGRVQQRAIDMADLRDKQVGGLLETIQAILSGRVPPPEATPLLDQERLDEERRQARGEFAADFLPALDGLEAVLEEGRHLLARHRQEMGEAGPHESRPGAPSASGSLVHRLRTRITGEGEGGEGGGGFPSGSMDTVAVLRALSSWLRSLALVRDRFISLMVQEGIQPIPALRQKFDPQLHIAVQSEIRSDVPPDTIVRELRKGFRQGQRVLRYAEVVVARAPTPE